MKYDVLIAGAGLAGSTAARLLAENNKKVLIVERLNHIAGHCYDFKNKHGITVHKYGPHILHTDMAEVWEFLKRFTQIRPYEHRVLSSVNGMLLPFPINRDTIARLYDIDIPCEQVKDFLKQEVGKARFSDPPRNFRDQVVSQVGQRLYDTFYRNYTIKQWQKKPEQLSAEIAARIPVRDNTDDRYFADEYQGIPLPGYTALAKNMLDHPNITVELATDFFKVTDHVERDITVFTGLLDQYFHFKYGKLEYRSLKLVFDSFSQEYYQPAAVVNYPNEHEWTRITEFKYFTGESSPYTTVCFEYPKDHGEPYYVVVNRENTRKRNKYMKEVENLEKQGSCFFIGRLAEYKYYNMDQVIAAAMKKVDKILS
ncbi:MAG: UDP-galactopyranose mutase [Spirochaetales bacterium]|nr:UDP-galactopyranose mutase [Spirochaetales bacterium]